MRRPPPIKARMACKPPSKMNRPPDIACPCPSCGSSRPHVSIHHISVRTRLRTPSASVSYRPVKGRLHVMILSLTARGHYYYRRRQKWEKEEQEKQKREKRGRDDAQSQRKETVGLTFGVAGAEHSLICGTGANVPYLPSLVQEDVLINVVILVIKVNDVDLQEEQGERGEMC